MSINNLTFDDLKEKGFEINLTSTPTIIAEGDSWFEYYISNDIIDFLKSDYNYNILNLAKAGDTLDNMINNQQNFDVILDLIQKPEVKIFLFSGGGNDIAGDRFSMLLNHKSQTKNIDDRINMKILNEVMSGFKKSLIFMIDKISSKNSEIKIICHGYAHAIPDGRAVLIPGFIGPWLKPSLDAKGYTLSEGKEIVKSIIDYFNDKVLNELANKKSNFIYIDLRNEITDKDWDNELHLKSNSFKKVAKIFHHKIRKII